MKKPIITFEDLLKLDIRVGKVMQASLVDGSSKLIELTVDLGEDYGQVTIFTGMQKWYTPENFEGKTFIFVANLEPKKMMGRESQGMILAGDENGKPLLFELIGDYPAGLPVI